MKVVNPKSNIQGDTAVLSHDLNETETIFSQNITARYHGTDTWMYHDGKWQLVAGHRSRYDEDPAPGKGDIKKYTDYAGTYKLAVTQTISVRRGGCMHVVRKGPEEELVPESSDIIQ
jgi:hypothetical protein